MLGQIETGKSVPTITVLWKVAAAIGVPVAKLVTDPDVPLYKVTRRADREKADTGAIRRLSLTDADGQAGYSFEEIFLAAGHREVCEPRRDGVSASFVVASGAMEITIGDEPPIALDEGDAISFSANLQHAIANNGARLAILYLVIGSFRKGS